MVPSLTFIVPGLLDPVPYLDQLPVQDLPELNTFSRILSRGEFYTPDSLDESQNNLYHCLLNQFFSSEILSSFLKSTNTYSHPSIASFSFLADVKALSGSQRALLEDCLELSLDDKWIMRADPSFMAPDRDQLVLARSGEPGLSFDEARLLVDEINLFYKEYKEESFWTLYAVSPERWYIVSDKAINISSVPPEKVLGQSVKSFLFGVGSHKFSSSENSYQSSDSAHWLNLFNEFQMILHQSEVNKTRIEQKKTPVNSLWLWGVGKSIDQSSYNIEGKSNSLNYSNHPFVKNLSQLSGQTHFDLPERYELNSVQSVQKITYLIDDFSKALHNKDIFSWVGLLQQFEQNYFIPLLNDLNAGSISQVTFLSPTGRSLFVTKKNLKRWWKSNQKYHSFLCAS